MKKTYVLKIFGIFSSVAIFAATNSSNGLQGLDGGTPAYYDSVGSNDKTGSGKMWRFGDGEYHSSLQGGTPTPTPTPTPDPTPTPTPRPTPTLTLTPLV